MKKNITTTSKTKDDILYNENIRTHLGYIQNVITRMAQNSFQCKTWCISIISVLLTLYLGNLKEKYCPEYICITVAVILGFGLLDSYYLYQEREYRDLYDVAAGLDPNRSVQPYDMHTLKACGCSRCLLRYIKAVLSLTTILFYGIALIVLTLLIKY